MRVTQSNTPAAEKTTKKTTKEEVIRQNAKKVFAERFDKDSLTNHKATPEEIKQFEDLCVKLGIIPLSITSHYYVYGFEIRPYAKLHYIDIKQKKELSIDIYWSSGTLKPRNVIDALKGME